MNHSYQYVIADDFCSLEWSEDNQHTKLLKTPTAVHSETVRVTRLGNPQRSRTLSSTDCICYDVSGVSSTRDGSATNFLFAGPVALRWYAVLSLGTEYHFTWRPLDDNKQYVLQISSQDMMDPTMKPPCEHLIPLSDLRLLVDHGDSSTSEPLNLQAVIVYKSRVSQGWMLWLTDEDHLSKLSSDVTLNSLVQLHLPWENPWPETVCCSLPFSVIRAYQVHCIFTNHQPIRLIASTVSRCEIIRQRGSVRHANPSRTLSDCDVCYAFRTRIGAIPPSRSWLISSWSEDSPDCIRVRGLIVRCLEFACYILTYDNSTSNLKANSKLCAPHLLTACGVRMWVIFRFCFLLI